MKPSRVAVISLEEEGKGVRRGLAPLADLGLGGIPWETIGLSGGLFDGPIEYLLNSDWPGLILGEG